MIWKNNKQFFCYCRNYFTLVEAVLAIAILAMTMVGILGITMDSSLRMGNAVKYWEQQHMLNQAVEYYLLAGPHENIPNEFFPFEGYHAECSIEQPELPEQVKTEVGSWRFVTLKISIHDDNREIDSISIDQILRAEDVE